MQDGAWINGDVRVLVDVQQSRNSKSGKPFWPILLTDPDDPSAPQLPSTVFADPSRYHGRVCIISGKGNKKGSYGNKPQIEIGKQGFIQVVDFNQPAPQLGQAYPPQPQPQQQVYQQQPRPVPQPAPQLPPRPPAPSIVNGQTIGLAMNNAHLHMMKYGIELNEESLVAIAGVFLRSAARLERGEHMQQVLATAPIPRQKPIPGPDGSVNTDGADTDVPY